MNEYLLGFSQKLLINNEVEIIVTIIKKDKVKLGIKAPKNLEILRKEIHLQRMIDQQEKYYQFHRKKQQVIITQNSKNKRHKIIN